MVPQVVSIVQDGSYDFGNHTGAAVYSNWKPIQLFEVYLSKNNRNSIWILNQ